MIECDQVYDKKKSQIISKKVAAQAASAASRILEVLNLKYPTSTKLQL